MKTFTKHFSVIMLAGALTIAGCGSSPETGDNKTEGKSGINIETSKDGSTKVNMPGINVNTSKDGKTKVNLPGISVDADEKGSADINIGGMKINVKTDEDGSTDAKVEGVTDTDENTETE